MNEFENKLIGALEACIDTLGYTRRRHDEWGKPHLEIDNVLELANRIIKEAKDK